MRDVTRLLESAKAGDAHAAELLLPIVYDELRRLASARMRKEEGGQTLQATELVHEAYVRLIGKESLDWQGRDHFFGAAAEAMRRILIDRARHKQTKKHGGDYHRIELPFDVPEPSRDARLLQLDVALGKLEQRDKTKADFVKLRFFVGLTNREAADVLGISKATADRYWAYARAWLKREMEMDS